MNNSIPQDLRKELQTELLRVVQNYNRKNKKVKKSKKPTILNNSKSKINAAILSSQKSLKKKKHKTKKNKIIIERHTQTYTNINGVEKTTREEIIGDGKKIKITKVDKNGNKHVKTIPTPSNLLFNRQIRQPTPPQITYTTMPNFSKSLFNPRFL